MMTRYQHISFEVKSKRFMGWGERISERLFLDDGNYTIFPREVMGSLTMAPVDRCKVPVLIHSLSSRSLELKGGQAFFYSTQTPCLWSLTRQEPLWTRIRHGQKWPSVQPVAFSTSSYFMALPILTSSGNTKRSLVSQRWWQHGPTDF